MWEEEREASEWKDSVKREHDNYVEQGVDRRGGAQYSLVSVVC